MSSWYLAIDGETVGPISLAQLAARVPDLPQREQTLVWREGFENWLPLAQALPELAEVGPPDPAPATPPPPAQGEPLTPGGSRSVLNIQSFADRVADLAGVERLEGFNLGQLLSASFRKYRIDEIERHFSVGLPENTPVLARIEAGWPKPWMFVRMLFFTALIFFGFLLLLYSFPNPKLLPGLIVVGSFAVPMATLVFYFELNSARNVSLYLLLRCAMLGGLVSIAFALFLFSQTEWLNWLGPSLAGVVEELGKLIALFLITSSLDPRRYPFMLNGMLFGAAVGTGFAAFESAGYAFEIMLSGFAQGGGIDVLSGSINIVLRGLLAPFGHIVWTALVGGALWRVKLDQPLRLPMLWHKRTLRTLFTVMLLHALWNLTLIELPFMAQRWLLGFVAWVLAFSMLQTGLKQIRAAQQSELSGPAVLSGATRVFKTVGPIGNS